MTVTKKHTVQLAGVVAVVAVVAELKQRDSNFVYTEHSFSNGSFDATLKNDAGQNVNEPELFKMAQNAVNSSPATV